jgi:hypothetical protein
MTSSGQLVAEGSARRASVGHAAASARKKYGPDRVTGGKSCIHCR